MPDLSQKGKKRLKRLFAFIPILFKNSGFYGREKTGKLKHDQYKNKKVF